MENNITFQQYLQSAFTSGPMATDEVVEFVLPLFQEVLSFHENSLVGPFENPDKIILADNKLDIDEKSTHKPLNNILAVKEILAKDAIKGYNITEQILIDEDVSQQKANVVNLQVQPDAKATITRPVYLPGYQCYEMKLGHHDAQTDIFCLGLILASAVMGLDLYDIDDLNQFAIYREQPAGLNSRMHPTVCALVTEMTELNRNNRTRDLQEAIQRLKYYRDYDPQQEADLSQMAALQVKKPADRKEFILSKLKNRLFDTSRRNRMLYYKPNSRFINLTISSVPMVLHYQSINPQLLFTWNEDISKKLIATNDISLNKYLRFEDHPYLNTQLNSIRLQSETDKKEFGFSQLKLVVAFLHWHNLKEKTDERIQSPLLLLPVGLERKKSLKEERYTLKILDNAATINPVLSNYLKDLYGIELPETIDFDDVSMEQFFTLLQSKINEARQGVKLNYVDKPRIKIIHSIARQTINNYQKKLKSRNAASYQQIDYSYSDENYKPLGLEIFKQKVQPSDSVLEFLLSDVASSKSPTNNFAEVKSTFHVTDGNSNAYSWDFDICNIVLGNFNYKKMSLVSDYNQIVSNNIQNNIFDELFSNELRKEKPNSVVNNPIDWYHVIAADPTQSKAVLYSRSGDSYIIQGPPGTGKSQTITNLIADLLANDKSILFICEKRAALDVVYHRLQQNKLAELCCYIHDSQGDKKEFYKDLKVVYEDFLNNKMDLNQIRQQREDAIKNLMDKTEILNGFHQQLKTANSTIGTNLRYLIERLIALENDRKTINENIFQTSPDYHNWIQFGDIITQLSKALDESGAEQELAKHPFSNLSIRIVNAENPLSMMDSIINHAHESLEIITNLITRFNIPSELSEKLQGLKNLIEDAILLEPVAKSNNLNLVERTGRDSEEFEKNYQEYKDLQKRLLQATATNQHWQQKFSKQDIPQALALAQQNEKSFFSFFNGSWRRLKKQLQQAYNFSAHPVKPLYSDILKQLKDEYELQESAENSQTTIERKYHISNIETIYNNIETLRKKKGDKEVDFLLSANNADELVVQLSKLNNVLLQLELQLKDCLYDASNKTISQLKDELNTIKGNGFALKQLLPFLRQFSLLPERVQEFIRKIPVTSTQAEAAMASQTLEKIYSNNQSLAISNQALLQHAVNEIEVAYKKLLRINSEYIRAKRRSKFLANYEMSNASISVLKPEQRILKKEYSDGRKIIEREMNKTMRYRTIREIASNESGKVLKDIKPVWLMSPLSVSDSLPLDAHLFDVVIFDEASQITLEEGVPSLFRAPQTIIVGDDKQMPPSNFFNARAEDPNDLETFEGEAEDEILSTDADSLLVQGSRKLNNTMLSWHYRSRHEALISYSNHAFYEGGLLTIPDKTNYHSNSSLLEVLSVNEGVKNAQLLLKTSISYHYLANSIYENRGNQNEAKYIAEILRKLLKDNIHETVGIVAFSQEQQSVIEAAIDDLAATDPIFEELLEKAYNRKEEGQFTGVFIKNLENVQGDERDIIIMSVCYGFDTNKKMLMNFGPINKKGGEKRLNVIFSRAKKHMAVISSIRHHHITNDYNPGANYFKRFLHYAELVSTGNMNAAQNILATLNLNQITVEATENKYPLVATQIKQTLTNKGYIVDENIGQSNFKCTLGIKKSGNDKNYILGILVDDDSHYENDDVIEQYFQRPSILKSFGWKIMTVFAKDWLDNKEFVLQTILNNIQNVSEPINVPKPVEPKNEPVVKKEEENITRLISPDSMRFWEVNISESVLHIRFGKLGTPGQVQIKTFSTTEEAAAIKEILIKEQQSNGFCLEA